jgi:hypothetical protein
MFLKGEDVNVGFARETVRGTAETPSIWVPARTPSGIRNVVEKTQIKETKGTGMSSQGSVMVQKRSEGDLEFNLRSSSIGMFFLSLLGKVTTSANGDAYSHLFEILTGNPQHPTLTIGLSQLGQQDYQHKKAICTQLEVRTPVDDLVNATANFVGVGEETHADYTPSFSDDDYHFRPYDVTIKLATNVAGLAAAPEMALKEFSITLNNNGRVNQNIGELTPSDVFAVMQEISGSMKLDYTGETNHDIYAAEAYRAMQITIERSDINLDDVDTTIHPKIEIVLPKVSFTNLTPDRPIDDIVSEDIDFMTHYDDDAAYGIQVTVVNTTPNYN